MPIGTCSAAAGLSRHICTYFSVRQIFSDTEMPPLCLFSSLAFLSLYSQWTANSSTKSMEHNALMGGLYYSMKDLVSSYSRSQPLVWVCRDHIRWSLLSSEEWAAITINTSHYHCRVWLLLIFRLWDLKGCLTFCAISSRATKLVFNFFCTCVSLTFTSLLPALPLFCFEIFLLLLPAAVTFFLQWVLLVKSLIST